MNKKKCTNCKQKCEESGVNFARRTRDIFNPMPFICRECNRIQQALSPSERTIKLRAKYQKAKQAKIEKQERLKSAKKNLKKSIKQLENNHLFQEEKKIHREKLRNVYKEAGAKTRAKRKKAFIDLEYEERKAIREFYHSCPEGYHVDHIIPISKGGIHCLLNLQYLKAFDNISKGNKIKMEIFERHLEGEMVSVTWLQRKFKLSYEAAEKIMKEIGNCTT